MSTLMTKKCVGLYTASNRYDVPEGALTQATNIIIRRDGVIQPRWGVSQAVADMTASSVAYWHRLENLNGLIYTVGQVAGTYLLGYLDPASPAAPTSLGGFGDAPSGTSAYASAVTPFFDVEMVKTNGNIYYNGFSGMYRVPGTTNIRRAGGFPCAVAIQPRPISAGLSRSGTTTVTATTAFAHGYLKGISVTLTSAGDGNFGAGDYVVVSVPSATTFTYVDATASGTNTLAGQTFAADQFVGSSGIYADAASAAYRAVLVEYDVAGNEYVGEVSGRVEVTNSAPYIGAGANKNAQLAILFGVSQPAANTKVQLYRSQLVLTGSPSDTMFKVYEKFLTEDERNQGYIWITPESRPDSLTGNGGEALYTNDGEQGLDHNNLRPGGAKTVALWGDMLVQANTTDHPTIEMQLLSTDSAAGGLASHDQIAFDSTSSRSYRAVNSGTALATIDDFVRYSGGTASADVRHTVLSLIDTINWNGVNPVSTYIATFTAISGDWPGIFAVGLVTPDLYGPADLIQNTRVATTGQFTPPSVVTRTCWAPALGVALIPVSTVRSSGVVTVTFSDKPPFVVGEKVTVYSTYNTTTQTEYVLGGAAVKGTIKTVTGSTIVLNNAGSDASGAGVFCTLQSVGPKMNSAWATNRIKVSRHKAVEAFPAFTTLDVGQPNMNILKCVPCGTSLMVFKEDGLFRVIDTGGDNEPVLAAQLVDPTCLLWAKDSAVAVHGAVIAWLVKGVALLNEQGVQKYISEPIYDQLQPDTLQTLPYTRRALGVAIPADDIYELRIAVGASPSVPFPSTANYIYNTFTGAWATDDLNVLGETVYNGKRYITVFDKSLLVETSGGIYHTSKDPTTALTGTYTATASPHVFTTSYSGENPVVGAELVVSLVNTSTSANIWVISASAGVLTFYDPSGACAAAGNSGSDPVTLQYTPVISTVAWAAITFDDEAKTKNFRELSVLLGLAEIPFARVRVSSEVITTQELIFVYGSRLGNQLASPSNSVLAVSPAAIRTYVPQQHRRGQQLKVQVQLTCANSPWTILGLAVTGDGVSERLSK